MAIVLGVIGGIVAVGLAILLVWKLVTTISDKRELARFEKETQDAKWDTVSWHWLVERSTACDSVKTPVTSEMRHHRVTKVVLGRTVGGIL